MPVVLLSIDGVDNATPALTRVTTQLTNLDRTLATTSIAADRMLASFAKIDQVSITATAAVGRMAASVTALNRELAGSGGAVDKYLASMAKLDDASKIGADGQKALIDSTGMLDTALGNGMLAIDAYTAALGRMDRAALLASASQGRLSGLDPIGGGSPVRTAYQDASMLRLGPLTASETGRLGANLGPLGGSLGAGALGGGMAATFAGLGVLAAGVVAIYAGKLAAAYQDALQHLAAQTGASQSTMTQIGTNDLNYAGTGTVPYTPLQLAQGNYFALSSGIRDQATLNAYTKYSAQSAAILGQPDLTTTGTAITDLQDAYGGGGQGATPASMQKYSDMLVQAEKFGKAPPGAITAQIAKFAIPAQLSGVSAADALAGITKETGTGTTARYAATQFSALLTSLILKPTAETQKLGETLHLPTGMAAKQQIESSPTGFYDYLREIQTKIHDSNVLSKFIHTVPGLRAFGTMGLSQGQEGGFQFTQGLSQNIQNSAGVTQQQFGVVQKSPIQQWQDTVSRFESDMTKLGTTINTIAVPALATLATKTLDAADAVGLSMDHFVSAVDKFAADHTLRPAVDAVGNAAGGFFGGIASTLGSIGTLLNPSTAHAAGSTPSSTFNPLYQVPGSTPSSSVVFTRTASVPGSVGTGSDSTPGWEGHTGLGAGAGRGGARFTYDPAAELRAQQALAASSGGLNSKQLLSDRGAINYDLATQASATALNAAVKKLADDLTYSGMAITDQRNYLEKYAKPVTTQERAYTANDWQIKADAKQQALLDAQQTGASPAQQKRIFDQQIADQRQVTLFTMRPGGAETRALAALTKQQQVGDYGFDRAGRLSADQDMLTAAQGNLTAAQQMNAMPAQLKVVYDAYLAAERQQILDSTAKGSATQIKQLAGVTQQGAVFDYGQRTTAMDRTLKDLTNQVTIDKLNPAGGGRLAGDTQALLTYQMSHAAQLKLDPTDIALLKAQTAQSLLQTNPIINQHPFFQANAGIGGLEAGFGSTAVRLGGGKDPLTTEIANLTKENAMLRREVTALLGQIVTNTGARQQAAHAPASVIGQRSYAAP